jgi:hypothetical protein
VIAAFYEPAIAAKIRGSSFCGLAKGVRLANLVCNGFDKQSVIFGERESIGWIEKVR